MVIESGRGSTEVVGGQNLGNLYWVIERGRGSTNVVRAKIWENGIGSSEVVRVKIWGNGRR